MEYFGAVFELDLTEETRTQLQEEEAIASSCLILATSVFSRAPSTSDLCSCGAHYWTELSLLRHLQPLEAE